MDVAECGLEAYPEFAKVPEFASGDDEPDPLPTVRGYSQLAKVPE